MFAQDMESYRTACVLTGPVLFDRGLPDVVGYLELCGLPVPEHIAAASRDFRYNRHVFIAPPWRHIFVQDAERKQDFVEAEATHRAMVKVYSGLGYDLVTLPAADVAERVRFVQARIG